MLVIPGSECEPSIRRQLAQLLIDTFGSHYPAWTIEQAMDEVAAPGPIPFTVVAIDDGAAVGCASLLDDDEVEGWDGHLWLGNVVVRPSDRGRGIGTLLVNAVVAHARRHDVESLHLVTDTAVEWYVNQHWAAVGLASVHGHPMSVMRTSLRTPSH